MSDAFITRRGGAGGGLNFKVVGGTTQPSNPKENTIWVNTPNEITEWGFGVESDKPERPETGMVGFVTSGDSCIKFNALKDDGIIVTPTAAYQYISGSWKGIADVKIHQDGEWVLWWNGELYTPGNEWTAITGGWDARVWAINSNWTGTGTASLKKNDNNMIVVYTGTANSAVAEPIKDIDLTPYSTLFITTNIIQQNGQGIGRFYITKRHGKYVEDNDVVYMQFGNKEKTTLAVDVSNLSGLYDIAVCATQGTSANITIQVVIYDIRLE